jgi:hypothetical protein
VSTPCKALEAMKREILEHGVRSLRAKGIAVRLESINGQQATIALHIVDDKGTPLVEITKNVMKPNDSVQVLDLDEAFHFSLE